MIPFLFFACAPSTALEVSETAVGREQAPLDAFFTSPGTADGEERDALVDDALVELLDSATATADLAIYDLDHEPLIEAILAAQQRAVHVRVVGDEDEAEGYEALETAGIEVSLRPAGDRIMHHKFAVVDGEHVWTGSTNWTWTGHYRNNNNGLRVSHAGLAADYTATFDQMADGVFGRNKEGEVDAIVAHRLMGSTIEAWFSPQHEPVDRLIEVIEAAQDTLVFMVFSFTRTDVLEALVAAQGRGVTVAGIFDESQAYGSYSVDEAAAEAGLPVFIDGNENTDGLAGGKLHHKVLVADRRVLVTGSMNWSTSGNEYNDEDLLVMTDSPLAGRYQREFCRRAREAVPHTSGSYDSVPMGLCGPTTPPPAP